MGSTDTAAATTRFDVASRDGTSIAVWVDGEGQPLVMVHGSLQDHTASGALVDELRADTTTFALDRRGLGASGDRHEYAIEREFEDVAAVAVRTEPRPAARPQVRGLLDLDHAEPVGVEGSRGVLAARRTGDLDVVQGDHADTCPTTKMRRNGSTTRPS